MKNWFKENKNFLLFLIVGIVVFFFALLASVDIVEALATEVEEITVEYEGEEYAIPVDGYQYWLYGYIPGGKPVVYLSNSPLTLCGEEGSYVLETLRIEALLYYLDTSGTSPVLKTYLYEVGGANVFWTFEVYYSNYDIYSSETGAIVFPANTYTEEIYNTDSAYLSFAQRSFINGFTMDDDINPDNSWYTLKFNVVSGVPEIVDSYTAEMKFEFYLPTKEWVASLYELYLDNGFASRKELLSYLDSEKVSTFIKNTERGSSYYEIFVFPYTVNFTGDYVEIRLTYREIKEAIEAYYGFTLAEYYNLPDDSFEMMGNVGTYIYPYFYIGRVSGFLYSHVGNVNYYGHKITWLFAPSLSKPVVYEHSGDPLFIGPTVDDEANITNGVNQAYLDMLEQIQAEKNGIETELNDIYIGSDAYSDLSASDIWSYAKNTANGLMSSLGWIKSLGSVVTAIFGFIPGVNENIIIPVFIICIITAIIAFIRGK